jgi:hypothetical protein
MTCVDVNPNIFDDANSSFARHHQHSKNNKLLINQNKTWNQNLINKRLNDQGFQNFIEKVNEPTVSAIEKQTGFFKPFVLKLNINEKVFKTQSWFPRIKEIVFTEYGEAKEITQADYYFYLTKNLKNEIHISNISLDVKFLFTNEFKKCFEGWAFNEKNELVVSIETVKDYLKLIGQSKANKYFKKLHDKVNVKPPEYEKEGEGLLEEPILFLPDNPCELFYQLSKLLAAKEAGHNNTYNQVNAICKRLMEQNLMSPKKYKKILSEY